MHLLLFLFLTFNLATISNGGADIYRSYTVLYDPSKARTWSDERALSYITTVRLLDDDNHHIFQYRRYPCQYFYTDEVLLHHNNETKNECIYNTTTSNYEYNFQLYLDPHHVEPYILRNIAVQCKYINCSLSLLKIQYLRIGWNSLGQTINPNCSFDTTQKYSIYHNSNLFSDWISLRCPSLATCNQAKYNLEHSLTANIQLIYGSSYELETPYCSLEKNVGHIIETNLIQTNRLLEQLVSILQRGFGKPNERDQQHMKQYVQQKWTQNETNSTAESTDFVGEVHGTFRETT